MRLNLAMVTMAVAAAAMTLTACGKSEDKPAVAASAPEATQGSAQQGVERLSSSMTPADFKLREIQCREALSYAKMDKDHLPADLNAKVEAMPVMSFLKLVSQANELGLSSDQINAAQHNQMPRPSSTSPVTPEYITNIEQCLAVAEVANARDGVA